MTAHTEVTDLNAPRTDPVGTVREREDGARAVKVSEGTGTGKGQHVWCWMTSSLEPRWLHHYEVAPWPVTSRPPAAAAAADLIETHDAARNCVAQRQTSASLPDVEATTLEIEPGIGGLAQVDVSEWPGGQAHVWLQLESYAHAGEQATVVLQPDEARQVGTALINAARDVDGAQANGDLADQPPSLVVPSSGEHAL